MENKNQVQGFFKYFSKKAFLTNSIDTVFNDIKSNGTKVQLFPKFHICAFFLLLKQRCCELVIQLLKDLSTQVGSHTSVYTFEDRAATKRHSDCSLSSENLPVQKINIYIDFEKYQVILKSCRSSEIKSFFKNAVIFGAFCQHKK